MNQTNNVTQPTLSTIKAIHKQKMADIVRESTTRLTRKRVKQKDNQINLISEKEIRLLKRNNNISITTSPSINDGDAATVRKI